MSPWVMMRLPQGQVCEARFAGYGARSHPYIHYSVTKKPTHSARSFRDCSRPGGYAPGGGITWSAVAGPCSPLPGHVTRLRRSLADPLSCACKRKPSACLCLMQTWFVVESDITKKVLQLNR